MVSRAGCGIGADEPETGAIEVLSGGSPSDPARPERRIDLRAASREAGKDQREQRAASPGFLGARRMAEPQNQILRLLGVHLAA